MNSFCKGFGFTSLYQYPNLLLMGAHSLQSVMWTLLTIMWKKKVFYQKRLYADGFGFLARELWWCVLVASCGINMDFGGPQVPINRIQLELYLISKKEKEDQQNTKAKVNTLFAEMIVWHLFFKPFDWYIKFMGLIYMLNRPYSSGINHIGSWWIDGQNHGEAKNMLGTLNTVKAKLQLSVIWIYSFNYYSI